MMSTTIIIAITNHTERRYDPSIPPVFGIDDDGAFTGIVLPGGIEISTPGKITPDGIRLFALRDLYEVSGEVTEAMEIRVAKPALLRETKPGEWVVFAKGVARLYPIFTVRWRGSF